MMQKNLGLNDISALDFTTFCTLIADTYSHRPSALDGSVLAYLAKRMIAAETTPGGPYVNENGQIAISLNAAIGRLFLLMGRPLPNVDAYLRKRRSSLSEADSIALTIYKAAWRDQKRKTKKRSAQHVSYRRAAKTLGATEEPIKSQALQFLTRIEAADTTREIAAISHFAQQALEGIAIPRTKLNALGEANVHSWIAYTIYDHILDKDADATLLPAANICMRIALDLYGDSIPLHHPLQPLIARYFDHVDTASAWEISSCRVLITDGLIHIDSLPNYRRHEVLAWRSCIHILGPMIAASSSLSNTQMDLLAKGLRHYLIARQLGDDIHDWREDLTAGRISAVVALLLERQHVQPDSIHNLNELITVIQKDFLREGVIIVSKLILRHARHAHAKLIAAGCDPSSELVGLVLRLERMAKESIQQQQRFVGFQEEYAARANSSTAT